MVRAGRMNDEDEDLAAWIQRQAESARQIAKTTGKQKMEDVM